MKKGDQFDVAEKCFLATFYLAILGEHSEGSVCNHFVYTDSSHPSLSPPTNGEGENNAQNVP